MDIEKFVEILEGLGACNEALFYVNNSNETSVAELILNCNRLDWIIWIMKEIGIKNLVEKNKNMTSFLKDLVSILIPFIQNDPEIDFDVRESCLRELVIFPITSVYWSGWYNEVEEILPELSQKYWDRDSIPVNEIMEAVNEW